MVGVNVAGEAMRVRVEAQLTRWRLTPEWLTATDAACGVTNRYARPAQLGADRWASLVAAWRRSNLTDLFPPACIVVNAGTAVTIDALDSDGVFRGGLILPGIALMLQALAENTSGLRVATGAFREFPDNTADAIFSGAIQAVCGAIEQMRRLVDMQCRRTSAAIWPAAPHPKSGSHLEPARGGRGEPRARRRARARR